MKVEITRMQELETPREVTVTAANTTNYESIAVYERRQSGESVLKTDVDLPISMPDSRALKIARTVLYSAVAARNAYKFSTTMKHAGIEPGDVVRLKTGSLNARIRIAQKEESNGVLRFDAVGDLQSSWERDADLIEIDVETGAGVGLSFGVAPVFAMVYDLPRIAQGDPSPVAYVAVFTDGGAFNGAQLAIVDEAGNARTPLVVTSLTSGGLCLTTLAQSTLSEDVVDEVSTVDVQMQATALIDPLKSPLYQINTSGSPVYRGGILAVVGQEVVAFGKFEDRGDDVIRFSKLRRSVLNTPANLHISFERFDVLKSLIRLPLLETDLGLSRLLRVIPLSGTLDDAEILPFTVTDGGTLGPNKPASKPRVIANGDELGERDLTDVRLLTFSGSGEPGDYAAVFPSVPGEEAARVLIGEGGTWSWTSTVEAPDGDYEAGFKYMRSKNSGPYLTEMSPTFKYSVAPVKAPAGQFKFYRLYVTANHGGAFVMVTGFRFYDKDGNRIGTNLSYDETKIKADNYYWQANFNPWKAFDNDPSSFWGTMNARPNWLSYEFDTETAATRIELQNAEYQDNMLKDFTIEGSNDGATWTVLATVVGALAGASYNVLSVDL